MTGPVAPAAPSGRRSGVKLASVGLVIVVLAVAVAFFALRLHAHAQVSAARTAVARDGEKAITAVLSYDYRTLDHDVAGASAWLTPSYRATFTNVVSQNVRPTAASTKIKMAATVPGLSVVSVTPDKARLLMYVNQVTNSTATKNKDVASFSRIQVSMTRSGDRWLLADLRAV